MKMNTLKSVCIDNCLKCKTGNCTCKHSVGPTDGKLLLHEAARKYDCEEVEKLLDCEWNPDLKDDQGRTVLHVLLSDGFLGHLYEANMEECLKSILGRSGKCDVNAKDGFGETPLSLAVSNGFDSCATRLVQNGADSSVRTPKYRRMHSLSTAIAQTMPEVMMEILDSGVTLDYVVNDDTSGEPEPRVKIDWSPVLQLSAEHKDVKDKNIHPLRRHKYKQRETSFLYSLLDVYPNTQRKKFLTHPLVTAFLHLKSKAVSRKLRWVHLIVSTYPVFYMIFIYFLYFNKCKIEEVPIESGNEPTNSSTELTLQQEGTRNSTNKKDDKQLCEITLAISVAGYALMAVVGGFGLLEVYVQLKVDARYLKSWRTWVIRASLVIMGLTLWPALQFNTLYNITWQYPIAALGTFFAWIMFLIQMELIPQVKIYLEMLVEITLSVLKITLLFLPLLIGFYMGFNLMFFEIGGVMNFILMTVDVGSDEYEEMIQSAKDTRAWFQIIAYVFSVAFIIIIAIVFMNFLLGVSINDIQELKHNAKIMALSNKIQNLFVIDLVLPGWYNVVKEGQNNCCCSYGPKDKTWKLPENIRTEITLLLKSKYSIQSRSKKSKPGLDESNKDQFPLLKNYSIDNELEKRINKLERRVNSIYDEVQPQF